MQNKGDLADRIIEYYRPFRERRAELEATQGLVEKVLTEGADRVRPMARQTMAAVRDAMHIREGGEDR